MSLLHIGGSSGTSVVPAEGVDFDGTYDYLSRSTDLVGNVDSKTFTFSAWVYRTVSNQISIYNIDGTDVGIQIGIDAENELRIVGVNGSTVVLDAQNSGQFLPNNMWFHLLISVDLSSSLKRSVYVNDKLLAHTWTTYSNSNIEFTRANHYIGVGYQAGGNKLKGRLSNIFLDYTYRDLSIEANRRLFITADGKPTPTATLKALNPILYLPMKDAATAHINEGTGGNFTANGTFATSNRGANQDNCVASYFDGSADYLSRTSFIPQTDRFTFSCSIKHGTLNTSNLYAMQIGGSEFAVYHQSSTDRIVVQCYATGSVLLGSMSIEAGRIPENVTIYLQVSWVLGGNYRVAINGKSVVPSVTTNTAGNVKFDQTVRIATDNAITLTNGSIGELYFDTKYIDLATSNPFWDSVENKPVPVRKVIANTGVTPLIAMPIDASNAGKNYGTGGDFTANSAPYVGARGASEFWARSAKFDGSTGYLSRGALTGVTNTTSFSCVYATKFDANQDHAIINIFQNDYSNIFEIKATAGGGLYLRSSVASAAKLEAFVTTLTPSSIGTGVWAVYFFCIDLSDTNKRFVYINNAVQSPNYSTYINSNIMFTSESVRIGRNITTAYSNDSKSLVYLSNQYIDFSQEANRLKFVDAFNMPLDLKKQIDNGVIPKPLIYLPFDDPTNLGKNLGTGGNFTVNGTITQGADVNG